MRDYQHITESVRAIAAPIVRSLGLKLVEVECVGQGPGTILRVFIDKPGGVGLSDCEQVHISLSHALDVEDPVPHAYTLEVSSPGLDRPLKRREDYERSVGKLVNLKLRQPVEGHWRVVGQLQEIKDEGLTLALKGARPGQTLRLEWNVIAEGRREVEF
ncbi:MAG: ribosome maturation factor RimP [Nitrospiraceae bacterium]